MALDVGQKLGPYEILGQIGAGGMGEVYRARDERLKREVAIKVLPATYSADPERMRRFETEAQAAGALNHPNITAVYDIGSHDGAPYVVQELLEGETLLSRLAGGEFTPRRAIGHALQIAAGLAAAHTKGIVHRDLKPDNIFVTSDGRVKILDFGLAKLTQPEGLGASETSLPTAAPGTEPGLVMGTVGYMSPEQVRGKFIDARSDIFAFGAILYEMLSGKRAFHGDIAADTMSAILTKEPPDLSETNRRVPESLERIVRHCLEKSPESRFQSASDIAFDLEALSGASLTSGAQPTIAHRRRGLAVPLAAAVALFTLGVAAGWVLAEKRRAATHSSPTFRRVTFRRGFINSANFAPDGQTIVYSAGWDGKPVELFSTRAGTAEARPLGLPSADLLGISSEGEMALSLWRPGPNMLAKAPLAGGAVREVLEGVIDADWAPDGKSLAIVRNASTGGRALEFPIGKVLYRGLRLGGIRVSPRGDLIAVVEYEANGGTLSVVDREGRKKRLSSGWKLLGMTAWSSDSREIWFVAGRSAISFQLYASDLSGRVRLVLAFPDGLEIHDIAKDGRVLLSQHTWRASLNWMRPGQTREQDVAWLDWSLSMDLSDDGRTILFAENRQGGGSEGSAFLRRDANEPPIRLSDGWPNGLSPDGKWALVDIRERLVLVPTGAGEPRTLATGSLEEVADGTWMPDGKGVVFRGLAPGKGPRVYVLPIDGGAPRPITPEGAAGYMPVSPDGKLVANFNTNDRKLRLYPVDGGEARLLPGAEEGEGPIRWSADGKSLFVWGESGTPPVRVWRVDVASGKRSLWGEIAPSDPAGVESVSNLVMTPDGKYYAYNLERRSSDLYVVEGLK